MKKPKIIIGYKEWCALPLLHVNAIEAKVDTGAATSALHAHVIDVFFKEYKKYIRFKLFNQAKNSTLIETPVVGYKSIMSSNGIKEKRYIIKTLLVLGKNRFDIEVSLTDRSPLRYPMLLGRMALRKKFLIDPSSAHLQGQPQV